MDIFADFQGFVLDKFIPFVILLGLLIFVHELGHFLVAKFFKVRVEVFSLGFGKKIIQFVRGHTTYCISLIPLGGYVKMYGDDPTAEIPEENVDEAFNKKPVGQRIGIVLAGPLMNFFFAIVLFTFVALVGEKAVAPFVGDIKPGSFAAQAGFQSGDQVLKINGMAVETWSQVDGFVEDNINRPLSFEVSRGGQTEQLTVTPKEVHNKDPLKWANFVGEIEGLSPLSVSSFIGVDTSSANPALEAGLQPLDRVTAINGEEIKLWRELKEKITGSLGQTVQLEVERFTGNPEASNITDKITLDLSAVGSFEQTGIESSELFLSHISPDMPAERSGLLVKDKLLAIDGKKLENWQQVIEIVNGYKPGAEPFQVSVLRNGETKAFTLAPKINTFMNEHGQEENRYQIGIGQGVYHTIDEFTIQKADGLLVASTRGWQQTIEWTVSISVSFVKMLQAEVSPKNIGGIVTIGQVASETFKAGLSPYLKIMAIISINLFILNLLPIPILDGGHLVFYSIEALRGAPLSMKKLEIAQQIGLIILMSLMAFALFNDISRIW
jgi:regulator of sigma E protease